MNSQIQRLKKAKAFAWAKYYEALNEAHHNDIAHYNTVTEFVLSGDLELPKHMVDEYAELCKELHKKIECPICFDIIEEDLKITGCGHKYCSTCFERIDTCAICRRKIKKR